MRLAIIVKGNQPGMRRAIYDAIQQDCPREPGHVELDYGHGRIIKRSLWVAGRTTGGPSAQN